MTQPPRDRDSGAEPGRDGEPGEPVRDPRLAGFVRGGVWERCALGPELVAVLAEVAGPEWSCPGAEPEELVGVLRRIAAAESWMSAAKLGVVRELIRQDDLPSPGKPRRGAPPGRWSQSLARELALALAVSPQSADKLMRAACDLESRLPGTGRLLAAGTLTLPKAALIAEAFEFLSDEDAARAEEQLLPQLTGPAGKTYRQVEKLAAAVAADVDPEWAERQRAAAEKERSRVQMFRERSGAAALSGRDLPTDETLAAYANVNARAAEYKDSGAFPGARMDWLRATAYLDLLNGITAEARIAHAIAIAEYQAGPGTDPDPEPGTEPEPEPRTGPGTGPGPGGQAEPGDWPGPADGLFDCSCGECDGGCCDPDDSPGGDDSPDDGDGGPHDGGPHDGGPHDGGPHDGGPHDVAPGGESLPDRGIPHGDGFLDADRGDDDLPGDGPKDEDEDEDEGPDPDQDLAARPAVADLVIPLLTLLGLAQRPGEGHGLGPLDPALCRDLAATAANWPASRWCVTVTDADGIAIGHGCAKPARPGNLARIAEPSRAAPPIRGGPPDSTPTTSLAALPARVNLTIPLTALENLRDPAPPPAPWAFTPREDPAPVRRKSPGGEQSPDGPHEGYRTWTLRLPGGQDLTVTLEPVPTYSCDHRHESHAYQPNGTLRHLVQVRDWECTFPPCSRHARESDFEHAVPYDQGGLTCACNAGARSRQCHRVKQSPGWNVTQPRPGWHQWTTPAGWTYTQGPKRYPA